MLPAASHERQRPWEREKIPAPTVGSTSRRPLGLDGYGHLARVRDGAGALLAVRSEGRARELRLLLVGPGGRCQVGERVMPCGRCRRRAYCRAVTIDLD